MFTQPAPRLRPFRSLGAILIAVVLNVALALGIDQIFHMAGVYPPWGAPMPDTGDNLLALSYRLVIQVFAGVVGLRFAGYAPGWHAVALGTVGFAFGSLGAVQMTGGPVDFGPDWFPWAIALSAIPCIWLSYIIVKRRMGQGG